MALPPKKSCHAFFAWRPFCGRTSGREAIKENQDAAPSPCSGLRRSSRSLGLPDGVLSSDVLAGVLAVLLEMIDVLVRGRLDLVLRRVAAVQVMLMAAPLLSSPLWERGAASAAALPPLSPPLSFAYGPGQFPYIIIPDHS
ncbi:MULTISPECIES: hypothetical protein [unclassified Mesorhizobium]|uniref:hypothetical protein n=1 Tax=unclassified Mesorhizobium TaxID=325217 RepID=UPI001125BD0F|nr:MULTISPECIES: hypothetical protein [unclassified Mesorhizobium]MBZ9807270.1 hypothetical protein [Mesorhizobium sp. ESP-6-2]MBZ9943370.1 hypothetical protein [Mesorhizobium sp. BR1-1-13]TPM25163.1 hypothetical protein FJ955_23835 [Mesorhizobium sp. B2-2-2]